MKKRKYILFAVTIIIILMIVTLIIISKKQAEFLYCDSTTPRGNNLTKWQETITPNQELAQIDNEFFDKIEVITDGNTVSIKFPSNSIPQEPFPYEIREMTPDQPLEIGYGTLEFCGLGVAFPDANHIINENVPYKFFDANFLPEKAEIVDEVWTYNRDEPDSHFQYYPWPYVNIAFKYEGIEDIIFNGIKVFDAQTKKLLSTGYSSGGINTNDWTSHYFKVNIPLWHYTPLDFVIDVSFGPSKIYEFPPKVGEGFKKEGFECRIINISEDINPNSHSMSSSKNIVTFKSQKAKQGNIGTRFHFTCLPTANQMPVTFDFFDKEDIKLRGGGYSTSGQFNDYTLHQTLDKVEVIQAKYRTNRYRIIVHLPYIPCMPEQNKNIENLFDVSIPYVMFDSENRLDEFLYGTLQLDRTKTTGQKPYQNTQAIQFPIVFSDVTIRDIAKQYAPKATLNTDLENDVLEIIYPIPFLTKLKMLFYRIRQKNNE